MRCSSPPKAMHSSSGWATSTSVRPSSSSSHAMPVSMRDGFDWIERRCRSSRVMEARSCDLLSRGWVFSAHMVTPAEVSSYDTYVGLYKLLRRRDLHAHKLFYVEQFSRAAILPEMHPLQLEIERLYQATPDAGDANAVATFIKFRDALTAGEVRAAEKVNGRWQPMPGLSRESCSAFVSAS